MRLRLQRLRQSWTRGIALGLLPLYAATFTVAIVNYAECAHHFAPWSQQAQPADADTYGKPQVGAHVQAVSLCRDPGADRQGNGAPCRCGDLTCHGAVATTLAAPLLARPPLPAVAAHASTYTQPRITAQRHTLPFAHGPPSLV